MSVEEKLRLKVQVWIFCAIPGEGIQVLLLKTTPERGGFWQPVTGSVEPLESLVDAAARETREESGLVLLHEPIPVGYKFSFESRGEQNSETVFICEVASDHLRLPAPKLDLREHVESRWMSLEEASGFLRFDSNRIALNHVKRKLAHVK